MEVTGYCCVSCHVSGNVLRSLSFSVDSRQQLVAVYNFENKPLRKTLPSIHVLTACFVLYSFRHKIKSRPTYIVYYDMLSRGLVVKVLDSKFEGCEFKTHTGHGSFLKLRQFRLPYFASVYSAANEYKHCLEGICNGLVSRPGESV